MSNRQPPSTMEVYTEYVRLRQTGRPIDRVVRELQPLAEALDKSGLEQLNKLVELWEVKHQSLQGKTPVEEAPAPKQPAPPVRPLPAQQAPSAKAAPPIAPIKPLPTAEMNNGASVVRPIKPLVAGQAASEGPGETSAPFGTNAPAGQQFCTNCGKPNRKTDRYCYSCGQLLASATRTGTTKSLDGDGVDPRTKWGTAYLGHRSKIILMVRGGSRPIELLPSGEMVIGRSSADSTVQPDIDLTSYDAESLGVSRVHATIKREENTVHIIDMSSRNFTYVNGQRLYPRESRVLRHNDEVRLGRLTMKIVFKHEQ